jgi:predicted TIM-barrel enzyme
MNTAMTKSNRITEVFGTSPVLLPVIHPISHDQVLENVRVVTKAGVPGIFLINQGMPLMRIFPIVNELRKMYPNLWIGMNVLGSTPSEALLWTISGCDGAIDGIWSDNVGVDERTLLQHHAEKFVTTRERLNWNGLYFGGTAFKYQRTIPFHRLGEISTIATEYADVVCTSGEGTGIAADVSKVQKMHNGMGDHALALASGVTSENVHEYLPFVDAFLVGTGIESNIGIIDEQKVNDLMQKIKSYKD